MSGSGMTGVRDSLLSDFIISGRSLFSRLESLEGYALIAPLEEEGQTVFREVKTTDGIRLDYQSTMLSPGKVYLYPPREELFRISLGNGFHVEEYPPENVKRIILGIHPCDVNAVLYLDRTFMGTFTDPLYRQRRENTALVAINCTRAGPNCFCSSMNTGPFLHAGNGCDVLLTDLGGEFLVEIKTDRGRSIIKDAAEREANGDDFRNKGQREKAALDSIRKTIDTRGLDTLLRSSPDHPVWRRTAEELCLSCTNCVMVCPTCFCYDMVDEVALDLKSVRRYRQWDACQDARFAEVHGGNFRARRTSRLRQFVTHKLDQKHQYGVFGTVGCGRCITWCPTGIDLTEIAKQVQAGEPVKTP